MSGRASAKPAQSTQGLLFQTEWGKSAPLATVAYGDPLWGRRGGGVSTTTREATLPVERPFVWSLLAWMLAYLAVGVAVVAVQPSAGPAAWYPPLAIGTALLWTRGLSAWPAVLVADAVVSLLQYGPEPDAMAIVAVATTLEAASVVVVLRWAGFNERLGDVVDVVRIAGASVLAATVAAAAGTWATVASEGRSLLSGGDDGGLAMWRTWFAGDLTGLLTILPLLLLIFAGTGQMRWRERIDRIRRAIPVRWLTPLALALALAIISSLPDLISSDLAVDGVHFLLVIPVLWSAVEFGVLPTATLTLSTNATMALLWRYNSGTPNQDFLALIPEQLFMGSLAVVGLAVAVAVRQLREATEATNAVVSSSPLAIAALDPEGRVRSWNPACEHLFGWTADEVLGRSLPIVAQDQWEQFRQRQQRVLAGDPIEGVNIEYQHHDGHPVMTRLFCSPLRDANGKVTGTITLMEDATELRAATAHRDLLLAAMDQASEAIVITDTDACITYVNPAAESTSGYRRDDLVGANPRIFSSGTHPASFYQAMWETLGKGDAWSGVLVNRRLDGAIYEEAATISPVKGSDDSVVAYVSVKRDLTRERTLEDALEREIRERMAVADRASRIAVGETPEDTSDALVHEALRIPGIDIAAVFHFHRAGAAIPLAVHAPPGFPVHVGRTLPASRNDYFRDRAAKGPWAEAWTPRPEEDAIYRAAVTESGITSGVYAPIVSHQAVIGLLACASTEPQSPEWIERRLPACAELATFAAALLGPQLRERDDIDAIRARLAAVVSNGEMWPVFQPVVDLSTRAVVGYEALTRFTDGRRPDRVFAEARSVNFHYDLELAAIDRALDASEQLPDDCWVSVNISPDLIGDSGVTTRLLTSTHRPLVLEITEHMQIDDYVTLRAGVAALRPALRISVDDAGAGYASLLHITELRADFIKLDYRLVHDIDRDEARQALIAGMVHFAGQTGATLIAEGIETPAEERTVKRLGIELGQGFLYAKPMDAAAARRIGLTP